MNLFKIKSYLNFLVHSTNQHGVHSPFVYNLITRCLYDRSQKERKKEVYQLIKKQKIDINPKLAAFINRLIPFLSYQNAYASEGYTKDLNSILQLQNNITPHTTLQREGIDIFYSTLKNKDAAIDQDISMIQKHKHNDTVWIINHIHEAKDQEEIWNQIKEDTNTKVSIDLFHLGLVFFRKEQAKEHFVIRP